MRSHRGGGVRLGTAVVVALAVGCGCAASGHHAAPASKAARPSPSRRGTALPTVGASAVVRRSVVLGFSVDRRPILAEELGNPRSRRRVLVVGCIHGTETAGIAIARALSADEAAPDLDLWVVADLNPDGAATGRRGNAHGVDLNRNFPDRWQQLGPPGTPFYSGPHPLSEPESLTAVALLQRVRPTLGVWYHQALGVVDSSQGPRALERRYSAATGLPMRPLPDYPGSAVGYENQRFGPTAFVVELPAGKLSVAQLRAHVTGLLEIAARAPTSPG